MTKHNSISKQRYDLPPGYHRIYRDPETDSDPVPLVLKNDKAVLAVKEAKTSGPRKMGTAWTPDLLPWEVDVNRISERFQQEQLTNHPGTVPSNNLNNAVTQTTNTQQPQHQQPSLGVESAINALREDMIIRLTVALILGSKPLGSLWSKQASGSMNYLMTCVFLAIAKSESTLSSYTISKPQTIQYEGSEVKTQTFGAMQFIQAEAATAYNKGLKALKGQPDLSSLFDHYFNKFKSGIQADPVSPIVHTTPGKAQAIANYGQMLLIASKLQSHFTGDNLGIVCIKAAKSTIVADFIHKLMSSFPDETGLTGALASFFNGEGINAMDNANLKQIYNSKTPLVVGKDTNEFYGSMELLDQVATTLEIDSTTIKTLSSKWLTKGAGDPATLKNIYPQIPLLKLWHLRDIVYNNNRLY